MPILFVAHGAPDILLQDDPVVGRWHAMAASLPRPERILVVSAHWDADGFHIGGNRRRFTIHDFRGFPAPLYDLLYTPPSDIVWADALADVMNMPVDHERGLDHGAWVPLRAMYPEADIPVTQLAVSSRLSGAAHYALGQRLSLVRSQGVLILASGALVHNLGRLTWQVPEAPPDKWAQGFLDALDWHLKVGDREALLEPFDLPGGRIAVPTLEHYLPLLVAMGAAGDSRVQSWCEVWRYANLAQHGYLFA